MGKMIEFFYNGKIVSGLSAASGKKKNWQGKGSVELQIDWLKKHDPECGNLFKDCYFATINIVLKQNFEINQWDYVFDNVFWIPNCNSWSEKIAFKRCKLVIEEKKYEAWLYKPFSSPHKHQKNFIEIISSKIDGVRNGVACDLIFNDNLG